MPKIRVNNVELYYEESGAGPETLVFSHGYLMSHEMFAAQIEALKGRFRCVAYDHRGHGQSEVTDGGYEVENLAADGAAFIEALGYGPVHFAGMSTGGFVGMRIAINHPELLKSLILIDTSAEPEDPKKLTQYNLLLNTVKTLGWRPVIGRVMPILFHDKFLNDSKRKAEVDKWRKIITGHEKRGVIQFGKGIFARGSIVSELPKIKVPTVVMVGKHDVATPQTYAQQIADNIPDARLRIIPDAGHSSPVEKPTAVTEAFNVFFERIGVG